MPERIVELIDMECENVKQMLIAKNRSYGNSFQRPLQIFSKLSPEEGINIRIDDKLNRLLCGTGEVPEDTILDLIGYLILKRVLKRAQDEAM